MSRLGALITAAVGALALTTTAHAADPAQWAPPLRAVAPVSVLTAGWYLRGDAGYRVTSIKGAAATVGPLIPVENRLDDSFFGGFGAGFKWGHVRTDATVDFAADALYSGVNVPATASARIQTFTTLANAYYDIGTWQGVTPYVGAGAGLAYVRLSEYQSALIPPLTNVASQDSYNFAWALMAGVNYQLLPNVGVDLGYRFLDQGDARTGADASGSLILKKLQSHELRIGLRWMYDNYLR